MHGCGSSSSTRGESACRPRICCQLGVLPRLLGPRFGRRDTVHARAYDKTSHESHEPLTLDDIRRRRLRFGDNPSRRHRRQQQKPEPGLVGQLQQLKSAEDAAALSAAGWRQLSEHINTLMGRKLYEYFNWRQDTSKDLLVTFGVFSSLVLLAGAVRRWLVDDAAERGAGNLWTDVYQVCQWVFGQEFPGPGAPLGQQVLSVGTAMIGLAAFAMVLALVEQVVLEGLEANVKRGSKVFESGHILVLGWCVSQRDMEVVRKVVQQVCVAHAPEGGTTVVVMTQRSKLEMEGMFRRCLPEAKRFGTKLVFRQGSPLVPSDLKLVGASRAAATIVISDQSRCAAEADAQAVRCAILLDELDADSDKQQGAPYFTAMAAAATSDEDEMMSQLDLSLLGRHVVVELKTANALPLLKYACSSRVIPLPTSQLNAQRLAKMVKRPVISIISQQLFNFENGVSLFVHFFPHLVGTRFGDLAYLFPDGIVLGLVDRATGKARMAPSKDCFVQPTHALVLCRPTSFSSHAYAPLPAPPTPAQLRVQEALATWTAPNSSHEGEWRFEATPVTSHDVTGPAAAAAATGKGTAATAAAASLQGTRVNAGQLLPPAGATWKSGVSQVELLRQQVEAASRYSDGQPSVASVEGSSSSSAWQQQQRQLLQAGVANNIVPGPQLGRAVLGQVTQPQLTSAAAVPQAAGVQLASSDAGRPLLGSTSGLPVTGSFGPASSSSSSIYGSSSSSSSTRVMGPMGSQQGSSRTPGSGATVERPPGARDSRTLTAAARSSDDCCSTSLEPPSSSSSRGGDSSSTGRSARRGLALHTADWPVLSGAHLQRDRKALWVQKCNNLLRQQPSQPNRTRVPLSVAVDECATTPGWGGAFAADSSVEAGHGSRVLVAPSRSARARGLNDAAVLVPPEYFEVDERAEKVCVLGWGPNSLMVDLIKELDHGLSALPKGSEVVFVNVHNPHDSLGQALQHVTLENVQVRHVTANPLQRSSLAAVLDVSLFRCALVLCDELWVDPDNNDANGLDSLDEPSVLRLDSLVMVAQLNMRKLLEDSKLPAINIICQKVATEGLTRFEDRHRLPLGISVNLNSFAAKMLAQIAANPLMLVPATRLGEDAMLTIQDSSLYAALGEKLSFWQLMARCQVSGDVLLGYYEIPEHLDEPLNTVVNPIGLQLRSTPRVWNQGDGRLKFILLCHKHFNHGSTSGSHDDLELENTKQAGWVAARARATPLSSTHSSPQ